MLEESCRIFSQGRSPVAKLLNITIHLAAYTDECAVLQNPYRECFPEAWYKEESHKLMPLLGRVQVGDTATTNPTILAYPDTRLRLMNGSIPYLPCKVRRNATQPCFVEHEF